MTFPKQITIRLPELQRVALNALLQREADRSPSDLLERVVAAGISGHLARYADDAEASTASGNDEGEPAEIPQTIPLRLERDLGRRLADAMNHRPGSSLETFVLGLLELGLDAYEDDLKIVDGEPTDQASPDPSSLGPSMGIT